MRQWELIGITDGVPGWVPPARPHQVDLEQVLREVAGSSVFFWTTDATLRMRTVTPAAAELLGCTPESSEGRDLLEVVGSEGESLPILEAHVSALYGETTTFILRGAGQSVRCRVAPTRDASGHVIGTFCLAVTREILEPDVQRPREERLEVA